MSDEVEVQEGPCPKECWEKLKGCIGKADFYIGAAGVAAIDDALGVTDEPEEGEDDPESGESEE